MFAVEIDWSTDGTWTGTWTCAVPMTYARSTVAVRGDVVIVHAMCIFAAAVAHHALHGGAHDGPDEALVAG